MKPFDNITITNSPEQTNIDVVDGVQMQREENNAMGAVAEAEAAEAGDHHDDRVEREANNNNNNNNNNNDTTNNVNDVVLLQWRLLIVEICFTAIGVAVQALQTPNSVNVRFQFRCFRTAMMVSFASLLMSVYVYRYSETVALMFEHIGVFFGVLAFLLAVTLD